MMEKVVDGKKKKKRKQQQNKDSMITAGFLNYFRTASTHLISWFVFMTKQTRQLPMMSAMMSKVRMIVTATSDILRGCQICNMTC